MPTPGKENGRKRCKKENAPDTIRFPTSMQATDNSKARTSKRKKGSKIQTGQNVEEKEK